MCQIIGCADQWDVPINRMCRLIGCPDQSNALIYRYRQISAIFWRIGIGFIKIADTYRSLDTTKDLFFQHNFFAYRTFAFIAVFIKVYLWKRTNFRIANFNCLTKTIIAEKLR